MNPKHSIELFNVLGLIFAYDVYAYIDPGSAGYIFQLIIAALLGGLFAIKMYWRRIKIFFANLFSQQQKAAKDDD